MKLNIKIETWKKQCYTGCKKEAIKMLCQFSFQNFKSYRDETVFDLQATAIPEFKDNLIVKDKCSDLLPVSVILDQMAAERRI